MAIVIDTATVRIEAGTRDGEKQAGRAGKRFGQDYAAAADAVLRSSDARLDVHVEPDTSGVSERVRAAIERAAAAVTASIDSHCPGCLTGRADRIAGGRRYFASMYRPNSEVITPKMIASVTPFALTPVRAAFCLAMTPATIAVIAPRSCRPGDRQQRPTALAGG